MWVPLNNGENQSKNNYKLRERKREVKEKEKECDKIFCFFNVLKCHFSPKSWEVSAKKIKSVRN